MAELRIRYPLPHSPFTFRGKDSGKDSRRVLPPLENTRVNRIRQTFTLANNVEKPFWDGGAFSIFKESRVRIDYCKICRGGGGIQRRKIGRSPRNDKNGVFLGETGRFGSRRENDRFDENSKTGWNEREEKGEETRYKRSANGGINALLRPSTA